MSADVTFTLINAMKNFLVRKTGETEEEPGCG